MNKKLIIGILLAALICWMVGTSYYFVWHIQDHGIETENHLTEENKGKEKVNATKQEVEEIPVASFKITDGEIFSSESNKNVSFSIGKADLMVPEEIAGSFASINEYLGNNPDKNLTLNGLYSQKNQENQEIGTNRAKAIASYLTENYGIDSEKIVISAKENNNFFIDRESKRIQGGVEFGFENPNEKNTNLIGEETVINTIDDDNIPNYTSEKTLSIDPGEYEKVLQRINQKKTIYYPPSGFEIEPNITTDLKKYFKDLRLYFSENSNGLLKITGYTDNSEDDYTNSIISRRNAEKMKYYLMSTYGLKDKNIKTSGRGSSKLKDNDDSYLAKAQNRKVTFYIIK